MKSTPHVMFERLSECVVFVCCVYGFGVLLFAFATYLCERKFEPDQRWETTTTKKSVSMAHTVRILTGRKVAFIS